MATWRYNTFNMTETLKEYFKRRASIAGKARWANKTKEEKQAHMQMMRDKLK